MIPILMSLLQRQNIHRTTFFLNTTALLMSVISFPHSVMPPSMDVHYCGQLHPAVCGFSTQTTSDDTKSLQQVLKRPVDNWVLLRV